MESDHSPFLLNNLKIFHHRSPMKIGTDALLLGAYPKFIKPNDSILEIGSGCGIITFMTARQHLESRFLGIDIDINSVIEFQENITLNNLEEECEARCIDLLDFAKQTKNEFEIIISNPPFFTSEMLPNDPKSKIAKHTTTLSIQELADSVNVLLKYGGLFYVILPIQESEYNRISLKDVGIELIESMDIRSFETSECFRRIQVFSKGNYDGKLVLKQLTIYQSKKRNDWTGEYKKLLQDFKNF